MKQLYPNQDNLKYVRKLNINIIPPLKPSITKISDFKPNNIPIQEYDEKKSSGVAVLLSFFIPGLGQIYNGEIGKGISFIIIHIIFIILGAILILNTIFNMNGVPILIWIVLYLTFWIINMYDAYDTAKVTYYK